jgi:2-keto-4-pentenoate hydratase/2-oxohepta-3-ene-1,7-dioic acid hydratase in catechol pathway
MKIALFAHGDHNHIGIVTDFEMLDFSRAYQARQLIQYGEESPQLITDMVTLMDAGLFNIQTFESTVMFVYEHHLNGAFAVADPSLRTPIPQPGKLIALGGNYSHPGEEDPDEPPLFFKPTSSIIGPEESIIFRRNLNVVEPEIELTVIIGRQGNHISQADAMDYVAGYTLLNDVTARDLQNVAWEVQRPWSYTKGIDTFTPIGPHVVLRDAVSDPHNLAMTMRVNGEVIAEANTNTMLFRIPALIEYISQYMTLEPGDMIATGTPVHPPGLKPGDTVELEIEEIGILRNPVAADG